MPLSEMLFRSFDPSLPEPIAFNGWRHHQGFLKTFADEVARKNFDVKNFVDQVNSVKGSLLDLYTGILSCDEIAGEVISFLTDNGIKNKEEYSYWLATSNQNYTKIIISDGSSWTLTQGRFPQRFVHIHPSRYSKHTIRVKSTTLRTVIMLAFVCKQDKSPISIYQINRIRTELLHLSPVKSITNESQILKLLDIF